MKIELNTETSVLTLIAEHNDEERMLEEVFDKAKNGYQHVRSFLTGSWLGDGGYGLEFDVK